MIYMEVECARCNGSGEIAVRTSGSMGFVAPGPAPDDARFVVGVRCDRCNGSGVTQEDVDQSDD